MLEYRKTYLALRTLQVLTGLQVKPSAIALQNMLQDINVTCTVKEAKNVLDFVERRFRTIPAKQKELL